MKAEAKTFQLSRRLSIAIIAGVDGVVVEWTPDVPEELTRDEMANYSVAMAEMLYRLSGRVVRRGLTAFSEFPRTWFKTFS